MKGRDLTHLPLISAPEEKKAPGGGGPVRLRSTSRKDSISEDEVVLRERSYDYQFRYCGHCNTTTDIKEANFFGRSEALNRRVLTTVGSRGLWSGATWEMCLALPLSPQVPLATCFFVHTVKPATPLMES